jgi:2-polyprenyl-3-methyl-5-hydroxy-6-metoxy-1,4-benzoquinol methylase
MDTTLEQRINWIGVATQYVEPNSSVLDVGCGTGLMVETLPEGVDYYGIDLNEEYLEEARSKYPGYRFEARDFYDLIEKGEQFDYVVITSFFGLFPEDESYRLMEETWKLCRKGMFLTTLNKGKYRLAPGRSRAINTLTSHLPSQLQHFLKNLPEVTKIIVDDEILDGSKQSWKMAAYAWKESK